MSALRTQLQRQLDPTRLAQETLDLVRVPSPTGDSKAVTELYAERLRALVEQSVINDGAERIGVTLSIGAVIVRTGEDARSVVERVDRLLYRSKSDRSNRVTIEHEAVGD